MTMPTTTTSTAAMKTTITMAKTNKVLTFIETPWRIGFSEFLLLLLLLF